MTLLNHCGAQEVSRDELTLIGAPEGTDTWFPMAHGDVLDAVEGTLSTAGFSIENQWLSVDKDGLRFFGVLDLHAAIHTDVSLSVGIRNSNDKTFPISFCAGSRVFVCDNLAFSSEIVIAKRHTRFGADRYREGIANAVASLQQFQAEERQRISDLQDRELNEDRANSAILQAYEKGILTVRQLPKMISEWRHPSYDEFAPRTAWSMHNAFTEVVKPRFEDSASCGACDDAVPTTLTCMTSAMPLFRKEKPVTTKEETVPPSEAKKPVQTFGPFGSGAGSFIEVAVWENTVVVDQDREVPMHAVSFARNYREVNQWKKTKNMRTQDIPVLVYALQKAYDWLMDHHRSNGD